MNIETKVQLHEIQGADLYKYLLSLSTAQSNGLVTQKPIATGGLRYEKVKDSNIDIVIYKNHVSDDEVEITDFSLFIYALISFLETNVYAWLPNATTSKIVDGVEVATPVKWKDWKSSVNYDQPLHINDTHCIINCQSYGEYLTESEALIIIGKEVTDGIELMSSKEKQIKVENDFQIIE